MGIPARPAKWADRWAVLLARGFGIGRVPWAPGTFGSVLGLAWFGLLLIPGDALFFGLGCLAGVGAAIWACGRAEAVLGRHDPPAVVLDEIVAVPLCFATWLAAQTMRSGFPNLEQFLWGSPAWLAVGGFVAFRFFDIVKPWPVRQSQELSGGWGIVADDVIAAAWVNAISALVLPG